jgi:myo-inositol-1(or 4)-monophosphatase
MILPSAQPVQSDLEVAIAAVRAAVAAAERARAAPLRVRTKGVAFDVVTEADRAAEQAAADVLRRHRPDDGILGEEGTDTPGARRWVVDGVDGTVAFASGLTGWCSAVALEDDAGPKAAAVLDPATQELHAAERGTPAPTRVRRRRLAEAHVATFLRQDRLVLPGVRGVAHRLLDEAGLIRNAGPGSLELAWVAAGRLDGWIQPVVDPWDWLPGALLVTQAGGEARVVTHAGTRWHLAGHARLLDELQASALR